MRRSGRRWSRSRTGAGIVLAAWAACAACSSAPRATEAPADSKQPYIDEVKARLKQSDGKAEPQSASYIGEIQARLAKEKKEPEGSFIEEVRRKEPSLVGPDPEERGYTERKKAALPHEERGGAIQAVKEGRSSLRLIRDADVRHAFGFTVGATVGRKITAQAGGTTLNFEDVYGSKAAVEVELAYEKQLFHHAYAGSLGIPFRAAISTYKGSGIYQFAPKKASGGNFSSTSGTAFRFFMLPVSAGLNYRLKLLRYVQPFAQAGPSFIAYYESRNDGKAGKRGFSPGIWINAGAAFLLDWVSPRSTWDLYEHNAIKHYYLTVGYTQLASVSGDVKFAVSSAAGGFTFEF